MNSSNKKYNSFQIPQRPEDSGRSEPPKGKIPPHLTQDMTSLESYYEIEYDSCPMPGVGKFVLKSQKIEPPEKDEIRELFHQMRDIAREDRFLNYNTSKYYSQKVQQDNARVFYKQGMFMKDFEDTYAQQVPFSSYYPNYQMMGYEQLRTYFTWRTKVREGNITDTSVSYAFLYLYELLNNIGVSSPQDGLEKLMSFWNTFRACNQAIDKYVIKWLKDYHIYYDLPWSFKEFITANHLGPHYPKVVNPDDNFDLYCSISRYDIRKSGFYNDDTVGLIRDCFDYVIHRLRETFSEKQILLDDFVFQPTRNMTPWTPFQDALFYPGLRHPDKRVVLSEKEIYIRSQNKWSYHTTITTESGKQLVGYVLKQMESVLRKAMKYKYKLSVNTNALSPITADVLSQAEISLEHLITETTLEFYREATKTVVKVDPAALAKIRQETLITQEKLIVPEQTPESAVDTETALPGMANMQTATKTETALPNTANAKTVADTETTLPDTAITQLATETGTIFPEQTETIITVQDGQFTFHPEMLSTGYASNMTKTFSAIEAEPKTNASSDPWDCLRNAFNDLEKQALMILWQNHTSHDSPMADAILPTGSIKQFAQEHNIMLEVLIDGINEKAMDLIGDSLLDGDFAFYEDYTEQVKGMVEHIWQDKYPQE